MFWQHPGLHLLEHSQWIRGRCSTLLVLFFWRRLSKDLIAVELYVRNYQEDGAGLFSEIYGERMKD